MDSRTASIAAEWNRLRDALIAEFPELVEDDETLTDTLDGEAEALDLVARHIRAARHDAAHAEALASIMAEERERKDRLERRASKRRSIAIALMNAIGVRKVERPDFTASVRATPPKVEITDQAALPDRAWRIIEKREPDKTEIKRLLDAGETVPGAFLTNGGESLTVRTR